jgi:hypothetical protein
MKLTEDQVEALLNKVKDGETIVAHCTPTRAFRVVMLDGEKTFRVEQLVRQAGDKWVALSTHTDDFKWKAYHAALEAAIENNKKFLLEMRKIKVAQNQAIRAAKAGATVYVPE